MAFAITSGNFGDTTTWDMGVVPTGSEDAYANSFTIQVNGTQSCGRVRNDATTYLLPGMPIPVMTSNTTPTGRAFSSTFSIGSDPWRAFDQNTTTVWSTLTPSNPTGWLAYTFPTARIIKRYLFRLTGVATVNSPASWTFEGSNDEFSTAGVVLHTVTASNPGGGNTYTSPTGLVNTGNLAFTSYRINISANGGGANVVQIAEFEMTELTGTVNGGVAGGTFNLLSGSNLTCTAAQGVVIGSTTQPVQFSGVSGSEATLTANLPAGTVPTTTNYYTILHNGTGTLNINGDIVFSGASNGIINRGQINSTSTGILRINGAVSSAANASESTNQCIRMTGGRLFINGTVSGGSTSTTGQIIVGGTSIIEITGNVNTTGLTNITGGSNITVIGDITNTGTGLAINSPGAPITVTGALTVNGSGGGTSSTTGTTNIGGSVTISGLGVGVTSTTGVVTIGGNITASTSNVAVQSSTLVKCSGLLFNTNNFQAVYAPRITIEPTTTSITFQKIGGGTQIVYIGSATSFNLPATNDVRLGTVYGQSNEFTGSMVVQTPENVLLGTLVDNTVGTLIMTPDNLVQELGTSTRPVAVRLQNSSTVDTTGNQMASYNI
jgi:hypothetical protein